MRARCSQPLSTNQTPHPTTKDGATTSPIPGFPHSGRRDSGPVASKPNSVSGRFITAIKPVAAQRLLLHQTRSTTDNGFLTAHTPTNGECLSWCSLERR
jgi:hypothetical protein